MVDTLRLGRVGGGTAERSMNVAGEQAEYGAAAVDVTRIRGIALFPNE